MMKRTETIAVCEAILAITLWGISFIFIKIALREISPVNLIVLRYAMGALGVGIFAWRHGDFQQFTWADAPKLALVGAVGITFQQLLQIHGQVTANASVAAFLAATAPAFTVILAAVWLGERLRFWQIVGVGLASLGGIIVATGGDFAALRTGEALPTLRGNFLILLSSMVWAVFIILTKRMVRNRPTALVTSGIFFFGMLFTLPLFWAEQRWSEISQLSLGGWGVMLYVGILSTALAYLLNSHALKHIAAARVAVIQNMEPLSAMVAAVLILNESISWVMGLGGAAILSGVWLAERNAPEVVEMQLTVAKE
jgi:drug/metabolite transporter (DMT)-like permease